MASTRKNATTAKDSPKKEGKDRVAKRPARGFRRFRNGMLNVTPQGDEEEIVRVNQASPLLRLPPELRNRIWKYVLGGYIRRYVWPPGFSSSDPSQQAKETYGLELLSTCRQIYTETALLPYKLNTFAFNSHSYYDFQYRLERLKKTQRIQIASIQMEVNEQSGLDLGWYRKPFATYAVTARERNLKLLPALKHIHILVNFYKRSRFTDVPKCISDTRQQLAALFVKENLKVTFAVRDSNEAS